TSSKRDWSSDVCSSDLLTALKPAFDKTSGHGSLTAGNSSALSDGAAAVLLGSEDWAAAHDLPVKAWLTHARVAAVDFVHGEGLQIGRASCRLRAFAPAL